MTLTEKAIMFALKAHSGQKRKGTSLPYVVHLIGVMNVLDKMGADENLLTAGVLHDTLEDTATTYDDLVREFSKDIAELVKGHTDDKTLPWKQRKDKALKEIPTLPLRTQMLILADKTDNVSGMIGKPDSFWGLFGCPDLQEWYYKASVKAFDVLKEKGTDKVKQAVVNYAALVSEVSWIEFLPKDFVKRQFESF